MGTTSFDMKAGSMRKAQDFIVYPISKLACSDDVKIQSDNYIGLIDLKTGEGELSARHNNPGFVHFQIDQSRDKTTFFELSNLDQQALKMQIFASTNKEAGESFVKTDNSGAKGVMII